MVFVYDGPLTISLLEADRQAYRVLNAPVVLISRTLNQARRERHAVACGEVQFAKLELSVLSIPGEEEVNPGGFVRLDALKLQRGYNVEHQDVLGMIRKHSVDLLAPNRACP